MKLSSYYSQRIFTHADTNLDQALISDSCLDFTVIKQGATLFHKHSELNLTSGIAIK